VILVASGSEFPLKPVGVRITTPDNPEPTGSTDRCCKRATRDEAHWGKQDRMLDTKPLRQAGRNRHCLRSVALRPRCPRYLYSFVSVVVARDR
jgi:hypothetical protein